MGCSASIASAPSPSHVSNVLNDINCGGVDGSPSIQSKSDDISTDCKTIPTASRCSHKIVPMANESESPYAFSKQVHTDRANRSGKTHQDLLMRATEALRKPQRLTSIDDMLRVYGGNMDFISSIACNKSQVRIFTSSTFVDFEDWRNKLMEDVYPFLQELCGILGLEFSVVDMRWGVRESTADDHGTSRLCMQEIARCQELSLGPNFVSFLGARYGYRPFPAVISDPDFCTLLAHITNETSKELVLNWFRRDDNCLAPGVYRLQPVSAMYPDFTSPDADLQRAASGKWWRDFETMQTALRAASEFLPADSKVRPLFSISVTHEEVMRGLLENPRRNEEALVYSRSIDTGCPWMQLRCKTVCLSAGDPHSESGVVVEGVDYVCPEHAEELRPYADWTEPLGEVDGEAYMAQMKLINCDILQSGNSPYYTACSCCQYLIVFCFVLFPV